MMTANINIGKTFLRCILQGYERKHRCNQYIEIIIAMVSLTVGGLLYIIFRSKSLLMFSWFEELGLSPYIESLRSQYGGLSIYSWVRDSLPAGLWLFSYLFIMDAVWGNQRSRVYWTFMLMLPIIAILSEFMQLMHLLPGYFDLLDIASYALAIILFTIIKLNDK